MIRLEKNEFSNVTQLLNEEKVHCTFAYAVVEGKQLGKIYVDKNIEPKSCLIVCKSGKYLVAGDTNNTSFNKFLSDYLYNSDNHNRYFDLYSSSQDWIREIDEILLDNAAKLNRQLFYWDSLNSSNISEINTMLPKGFEIKRIDGELFEKYSQEMDNSYYDLWESANNFIKNGFGFCILNNNEFVSVCNTYYISEGFAEIDIVTNNKFRNQGFALITCSEFIKHCLKNNIKPVWDCDNGNEASKNLATKLGFRSVEIYKMHWWHENRSFVEKYLNKFNYNS